MEKPYTICLMIKDVEDLDVYRRSLGLLKPLGDFVGKIPKSEYHLRLANFSDSEIDALIANYKIVSKQLNKLIIKWVKYER